MIEVNERQLLAIEEVAARCTEDRNRTVADLSVQLDYDNTENSADSILRAAAHLRKTQAVTNTAKRLQAQLKGLLGTHAMNVTPPPFNDPEFDGWQ